MDIEVCKKCNYLIEYFAGKRAGQDVCAIRDEDIMFIKECPEGRQATPIEKRQAKEQDRETGQAQGQDVEI